MCHGVVKSLYADFFKAIQTTFLQILFHIDAIFETYPTVFNSTESVSQRFKYFFFSAWTHFFCPVLNKMNKKTPTGGKKENKTPPETPQKCNDFSEIVTFIWYKQTLL